MDHYGIGQAIRGMVSMFFVASRRTGRTTSLIESLKAGDRVICSTPAIARDLTIRLRDFRLEGIAVLVIDPKHPEELFSDHGTSEGRTLFDHTWVEDYYTNAIKRCDAEIDHYQRATSGFGAAHVETRRRAEERIKWGQHGQ